jgi:hypothetical protein
LRRKAGENGIAGWRERLAAVSRRRRYVRGSFALGQHLRQARVRMSHPGRGGGLRGPLIFGVVAATIELAIVLWVLYC